MSTITATLRRGTGALVALAVLGGLLTGLAPAASAADTEYGYLKITDKSWYLAGMTNVVHVDTEHATDKGFWFATSYVPSSSDARPYRWTFQEYGAYCQYGARYVGFNDALGTYTCLPDYAKLEALSPGYTAARDDCRAQYGNPYWEASGYRKADGSWGFVCDDWVMDPNRAGALAYPTTVTLCAPWEPQGTINGRSECVYVRYPWDGSPQGDEVTATASVKRTVDATERVAATATQTRRALRSTVRAQRSKIYRGRTFTGVGYAKVFMRRKATRTRYATQTRSASATASQSCTATTLTQAKACAESKAADLAQQRASARATAKAHDAAKALATTRARRAAATAAYQAARNAPVPVFKKRRAHRLAAKRAVRNLNLAIDRVFPNYL